MTIDFESFTPELLRRHPTEKWSRPGIGGWVGEVDFGVPPPVAGVLRAGVGADDLDTRLKTARDQAIRTVRDKKDLASEEGLRLGRHVFTVSTQALDLTLLHLQKIILAVTRYLSQFVQFFIHSRGYHISLTKLRSRFRMHGPVKILKESGTVTHPSDEFLKCFHSLAPA